MASVCIITCSILFHTTQHLRLHFGRHNTLYRKEKSDQIKSDRDFTKSVIIISYARSVPQFTTTTITTTTTTTTTTTNTTTNTTTTITTTTTKMLKTRAPSYLPPPPKNKTPPPPPSPTSSSNKVRP